MLIRHGFSYLVAKVLPALLTLVALGVYTRYLSPEEYGKYSLVMLIANVSMIGFFQWLILGVGRYLPECATEDARSELLSTVRVTLIAISVSVILVFLIASLLMADVVDFSLYLAGFVCAALALSELTLKILNADLKPRQYGWLLLFRSAVALGVGGALSYFGYGSKGVITGFLLGGGLAFFLFRDSWRGVDVARFNFSYLKKLFKYGMPLTVTYLLILVIDVSDRFFIKYYMGVSAVGQYSAPYDFTQYALGSIAAVVHLAAFPLVVNKIKSEGFIEAGSQLQFTFTILICVMLPATLGLAVCANDIGQVFFGERFSTDAAIIIPLISLGMFFSVLKSFYFDYAFQLSGDTRSQVYAVLVAAFINVICNILLIPSFGLLGAAVSTVVAFFCALIISAVLGVRSFPMPSIKMRPILTVVMSSIVMSVFAVLDLNSDVKINLALKVFFSIVLYMLCLVLADFLNLRAYFIIAVKKNLNRIAILFRS